MTTAVMISGMLPMALGAAQTAPLAIAVIGGLVAATPTTLLAVPSIYAILERNAPVWSPSIDPDDPASRYHEARPVA
jgi:Cu/Ag efflux pump CusA